MKKLLFIPIILLQVLFVSCERDVNIDFPDVDQKIVVEGFLSPQDEEVFVRLSLSKPYIDGNSGNSFEEVNDATVSINNVPLTFYNNGIYGTSDLVVLPGQTYNLEVSTPAGKRVTAQCTIPEQSPTRFTISDFRDFDDGVDFDIIIEDEDSKFNYYGFDVERRTLYTFDYQRNDRILENTYHSDDDFVDGKLVIRDINLGSSLNNDNYVSDSLLVNVYYSDEAFYKYFKALNLQESDDPISEPVILPTNINGGYGIFAGVNSTTKTYILQ